MHSLVELREGGPPRRARDVAAAQGPGQFIVPGGHVNAREDQRPFQLRVQWRTI
jgi:hypothetical protein